MFRDQLSIIIIMLELLLFITHLIIYVSSSNYMCLTKAIITDTPYVIVSLKFAVV